MRRLGEMIRDQEKAKGGYQYHKNSTGFLENPVLTLADAGISKNLAAQARNLAAIPESEFEKNISEWRKNVSKANERVTVNLVTSDNHRALGTGHLSSALMQLAKQC